MRGSNPFFPSLIARRQHPTCTQSVSQTSSGLTVSKVKSLYILDEADISKFIDAADSMIAATMNAQPTRLKTICKARGFTQQELSEVSGVTLRMIQLYE